MNEPRTCSECGEFTNKAAEVRLTLTNTEGEVLDLLDLCISCAGTVHVNKKGTGFTWIGVAEQ